MRHIFATIFKLSWKHHFSNHQLYWKGWDPRSPFTLGVTTTSRGHDHLLVSWPSSGVNLLISCAIHAFPVINRPIQSMPDLSLKQCAGRHLSQSAHWVIMRDRVLFSLDLRYGKTSQFYTRGWNGAYAFETFADSLTVGNAWKTLLLWGMQDIFLVPGLNFSLGVFTFFSAFLVTGKLYKGWVGKGLQSATISWTQTSDIIMCAQSTLKKKNILEHV